MSGKRMFRADSAWYTKLTAEEGSHVRIEGHSASYLSAQGESSPMPYLTALRLISRGLLAANGEDGLYVPVKPPVPSAPPPPPPLPSPSKARRERNSVYITIYMGTRNGGGYELYDALQSAAATYGGGNAMILAIARGDLQLVEPAIVHE